MTFFCRLRRLRRPVAAVMVVCIVSFFVLPAPSPAIEPVTVATTVGVIAAGAASIYMRNPAAYNQMFARWGSIAVQRGQGLLVGVGTFASAGKDKLVGFMNQAKIGMGKVWQWIKAHPGDAADIAGLGLDAWQALMGDKGMPHTADVVGKALNPSSGLSGNPQVGDVFQHGECGYKQINAIARNQRMSCNVSDSCAMKYVIVGVADESNNMCYVDRMSLKEATPPTSTTQLPETLTPEQAERLLNEIEKKLRENKEEMERELDELLKKNIDDIDWPQFDNDEAKRYLNEQQGQNLQDKIDEVQDEIERRRQEREENCQQQQNCQNQCCDTTCDDARLANRLDQLKDRLDDLNQRQAEEALQEYDSPVVAEVELKRIDFQPVVDLKGELMTKFPFNMLQAIPSAVQLLTAEPQAPYFDVNLGIGGVHRVDFAVFDGVASFIRLVLTFLIYIGAVFCCLKIWSRF